MRRLTTLLVLAVAMAACSDQPATETASTSPSSSTSLDATPTTTVPTTTAPPTTTTPTTTTVPPPTTTTEPLGMCGELIPVVTDEGTLCLTPEQAEWGVDVDPFWEGELPPIVVVGDGGDAVRLDPNDRSGFDTTSLGSLDGWVVEVRLAIDGSLVVQRYTDDEQEYWAEVVIVALDGTETVIPGAVQLYDVTVVDGREVVLVSGVPHGDGSDEDALDTIEAVALDNPTEVVFDLGPASGARFGIYHAVVRGGIGLVGGWAESTEFVDFRGVSRPLGEIIDPFADLPFNAPPYATAVTLNPTGEFMTWAEGPDDDPDLEGYPPAPWVIRSQHLTDGVEALYWPISEPVADTGELLVSSIHDLDDFIIVNRVSWLGEDWTALPALVIDFTVEEPDMYELPVAGLAAPLPVVG